MPTTPEPGPALSTTPKPGSALSRSPRRRWIEFLGLRRSIVGMLAMAVLVGMGEHMAEQFLPLYRLALGGGFLSVGFLGGMDNLLGALYSFPGGYLSDRFGAKRALLLFNLLSMAGFLLVILVPSWPAVLAGVVIQQRPTRATLPEHGPEHPGALSTRTARLPRGRSARR